MIAPDDARRDGARCDGGCDSDNQRQQVGHTLRLALAMRGGVSLAVWIGGAVAEIDVLRRAHLRTRAGRRSESQRVPASPAIDHTQRDRMQIYRQLLEIAGYNGGVEVDILAGASAGGLNAVLYGTAQSRGVTIDHLTNCGEAGRDVAVMRRPTPSPGLRQYSRVTSTSITGLLQLTALADPTTQGRTEPSPRQ